MYNIQKETIRFMSKIELKKVKDLINKILIDSFKHCEDADNEIAKDFVSINQNAHEALKIIQTRLL